MASLSKLPLPVLWNAVCRVLSLSKQRLNLYHPALIIDPATSASKVRRVSWWMNRYGAGSAKRQYAWANSPAIMKLDVGWKRMVASIKTSVHYKDRHGNKRWKGSSALKSTEILVWHSFPKVPKVQRFKNHKKIAVIDEKHVKHSSIIIS